MKAKDSNRNAGTPIHNHDNPATLGQTIDRICAEHDGSEQVTIFCALSEDLYVGSPDEGPSLGSFSITVSRPLITPPQNFGDVNIGGFV